MQCLHSSFRRRTEIWASSCRLIGVSNCRAEQFKKRMDSRAVFHPLLKLCSAFRLRHLIFPFTLSSSVPFKWVAPIAASCLSSSFFFFFLRCAFGTDLSRYASDSAILRAIQVQWHNGLDALTITASLLAGRLEWTACLCELSFRNNP